MELHRKWLVTARGESELDCWSHFIKIPLPFQYEVAHCDPKRVRVPAGFDARTFKS